MTKEQYERAVQISERLKQLKGVKDEINYKSDRKLTYANGNDSCCPEWRMKCIGELLDKHGNLIRAEIEEEINNLQKEIESL